MSSCLIQTITEQTKNFWPPATDSCNQPAAAPRGPPLTGQSKRWTFVGCQPNLSNLFQEHTRELDVQGPMEGVLWFVCHTILMYVEILSARCVHRFCCGPQRAGWMFIYPKQLAPNLSFKESDSRLVTAGAPAVDAKKKWCKQFEWTQSNNLLGGPALYSHA